jgi:hypothetical protein
VGGEQAAIATARLGIAFTSEAPTGDGKAEAVVGKPDAAIDRLDQLLGPRSASWSAWL